MQTPAPGRSGAVDSVACPGERSAQRAAKRVLRATGVSPRHAVGQRIDRGVGRCRQPSTPTGDILGRTDRGVERDHKRRARSRVVHILAAVARRARRSTRIRGARRGDRVCQRRPGPGRRARASCVARG